MPQGSILGPILFNIFINDLFLWLSTTDLHNFADDNTISAFSKDLQELIKILEEASECVIKWFTNNCFIYSNFNSCPLAWHFCSQRLINKIENIQKHILRFVLNDYTSNYETQVCRKLSCYFTASWFQPNKTNEESWTWSVLENGFILLFLCVFILLCIICTLAFICDYFCIFVYYNWCNYGY